MDLKQLQAIVTVAEAGSVTRAAQLLHLVQPAVTRQIRNLESELGVALFERTRQGMRPTAAGEALVERARRALAELERARAEIQPTRGEVTGVAVVGILESVEALLAQPLVEAIRRKHPGIELRLATAYSGHLQQWLDDGDLDVSLLYKLTESQSMRVLPLLRDQLWAVAPPDAGLTTNQPVDLVTVLRQPFIMPTADRQHGLRILIDQARAQADVEPNIAVHTNSMSLQKLLVQAGHGWTILPAAGVAELVARGELSAAPLRDPEISRTLVLGFARTGRTPAAVEVVSAELIKLARRTVLNGTWPSAEWLLD